MPNVLKQAQIQREQFDPTNAEHVESFRHLIRTGGWGKIKFRAEPPYMDVVSTVTMRFCEHSLGVKRHQETADAETSN